MSAPDKYLIWKLSELLEVCTTAELKKLDTIVDRMLIKRKEQGKPAVTQYIVVNANEPYAGEVIEILKNNGHWEGDKDNGK